MGMLQWESKDDLAIVDEAMKKTEIVHLADRTATQMSAGELQRVFIASALAQKTKVLLLDEPTSFLDLRQAGRLSRILRELQESGLTIICASHDLPLIRHHADRVLLIQKGRLAGEDTPDRLLTRGRLAEAFGVEEHDWYHDSHLGEGVPHG